MVSRCLHAWNWLQHTLIIKIFEEPQSKKGLERFSRLWEEIWEDSHGAQVWRVSLGLSGNDMESDTLTDTHITLT